MKHLFIKCFLIVLLSAFSLNSKAQLTVNGYTNYTLAGFNVLVEDSAFVENTNLTNTAINMLETNLLEITQFSISQTKMDSLLAVPIFVDWNTTTGAAQYHPSQAWLIANGYAPEKARCVEISNITNFINWTTQNQPYMVMHELAHAYHHRVLNFNDAIITSAYNNAISSNLYTNISYHSGNGNYTTVASAYGLNNEKEFFAELTEAYFGYNDFFPFDYNDLSNYDAQGFNTMVSIWGSLPVSVNSEMRNEKISVYPNPSNGRLTLDRGIAPAGTKLNGVTDIYGGTIIPATEMSGERLVSFDLSKHLAGVYFVRITQDEQHRTIKIIKE